MRLLKYEKSGWIITGRRFSLIEVDPRNTLHYAILSHRWGSDEVSFRDLESGTAKTEAGYKKLTFCAEQAARDGLLYFWIDTCCIDKTSSAELSEAINSMFKWYQGATKCYVYLPDVSVDHDNRGTPIVDTWEQAFEKSGWFTRGWTLQELIAPSVVEFFSVEGTKLGHKNSLERQLHQITGISLDALRGRSLAQFSEKERFSWTTRRHTTIEEDAVYCLLGIFGVHMPLIYGEGQQKALTRLQREINLSTGIDRNPRFTGRVTQLAELKGKIFTRGHTSKIAVTGLGGVGKTQLVLELLYRVRDDRKDCSVMWIPATSMESLQQGYLIVARQLGLLRGDDDENCDVKKLVQDHLTNEDAGPWLLVFDNADDLDMWMTAAPVPEHGDEEHSVQKKPQKSHLLIDFLPKNRRGCIIFTTRTQKTAVKLAQQNVVNVSEMSQETAADLLKKCLINPELVDRQEETAALLAALTYLPLALSQAAAYINENSVTMADYLQLLEHVEEEAIELLSEDFQDDGRYRDIKNPVATTWLISFEQIRQHDPLAADYLSFMACVDPRDIPQSLLPPGLTRKQELDAIGTLTAYSFISTRPAQLAVDLHRLVYLATRSWLRKEGRLGLWTKNVVTRLEEVCSVDDHKFLTVWRRYSLHVSRVLESKLVDKHDHMETDLMLKYGTFLFQDGRWKDAEVVLTELVEIQATTPGGQSKDTALVSMTWLAEIFRRQLRYKEAEQLEVQVLEACNEQFGPDDNDDDDDDKLAALANLAVSISGQGRLEEGERLQVQVLEAQKAKLGLDHPNVLVSMSNLAATFWRQKRLEEAEQLQVRVLGVRKAKLGPDHADTLNVLLNLSMTVFDQGRLDEAEQPQVQAAEAYEANLGPAHPYTLKSKQNLSWTIYWRGRCEEGEKLAVQVLERFQTTLGLANFNTLSSMSTLASIIKNRGRLEEAEQLRIQIYEASKTNFGVDNLETLVHMHNLAVVWKELGRGTEAIQLMRDCVQRKTRVGMDTHPSTLISRELLTDWEDEHSDARIEAIAQEDSTSPQDPVVDETTLVGPAPLEQETLRFEDCVSLDLQFRGQGASKNSSRNVRSRTIAYSLCLLW